MSKLIPIAFPLTPRMQSFIELRDALRILVQAMDDQSPFAWLMAEKEIADMLLGDGNKKPVIPNILNLFFAMGKHFKLLAAKHPDYKNNLLQAVSDLETHAENIRLALPNAVDFLQSDAWLNTYNDAIRKQDILGLKVSLPQTIHTLWQGEGNHANTLYTLLDNMIQAMEHLNQMLHAHVPWEDFIAKEGVAQVTVKAQDDIGLLIIGMPEEDIAKGIVPSCSGFRSIIRLRFTQWRAGKAAYDITHDQPYALMMVPVI